MPQAARAPAAQSADVAAPAGAPKQGGPALKIILVVVGLFALITVIGIGSCVLVGYRIKKRAEALKQAIKVDESGKSVTLTTPKGLVTVGEKNLGDVPLYPGSTPTEGGVGISVGGATAFSGHEFETSDPVDKVEAFYKSKLAKVAVQEGEGNATLVYTTDKGGGTVVITRDERNGKTKITITYMAK